MLELLKKTMMTGIGLALKTKNEVEELSREFIEIGKMNEEEGKKFIDEMMIKYASNKKELEDKIEKSIRTFFLKAEEDGKNALDDLKETYVEKKDEIEKMIDSNMKSVVEKMGIASVSEIKSLKDELSALRKEIAELKK